MTVEYRVITNSDVFRLEWRRQRRWPFSGMTRWRRLKYQVIAFGDIYYEPYEFAAHADACDKIDELRREAAIRAFGWKVAAPCGEAPR